MWRCAVAPYARRCHRCSVGYCACILSGARGKMRVDRVEGFVFLPMISSGYGIRKRW